jgi:hypothetical protein
MLIATIPTKKRAGTAINGAPPKGNMHVQYNASAPERASAAYRVEDWEITDKDGRSQPTLRRARWRQRVGACLTCTP